MLYSQKLNQFSYIFLIPMGLRKDLGVWLDSSADPWVSSHKEWYLYVVSMITRSLIDSFNLQCRSGVSVRISRWSAELYSRYLLEDMGDCYNRVITDLISAGFIGRGRSYQRFQPVLHKEGRCKRFWFSLRYMQYLKTYLDTGYAVKTGNGDRVYGKMCRVSCPDGRLFCRLAAMAAKRREESLKDESVRRIHDHLMHFEVDEAKASRVMSSLAEEGELNADKYKREYAKIKRFNSKKDDPFGLYVKRDRYGRIHSNVTQIRSDIRKSCVVCDGKPVEEVDIKSSQGSFLYLIFKKWKSVMDGNREECGFVRLDPFWMPDRAAWFSERMGRELSEYSAVIRDRRLYEWFGKEASEDSDIDRELPRDEVKKEWISFLFSSRHFDERKHPVRGAIRRVWRDRFPTLLMCIDEMKKMNYAALAYEMQNTESEFVFGRVCPAIEKEIGCDYCTIHDSVMVPREFGDRVKAIMDRELGLTDVPTVTELEKMDVDDLVLQEGGAFECLEHSFGGIDWTAVSADAADGIFNDMRHAV